MGGCGSSGGEPNASMTKGPSVITSACGGGLKWGAHGKVDLTLGSVTDGMVKK